MVLVEAGYSSGRGFAPPGGLIDSHGVERIYTDPNDLPVDVRGEASLLSTRNFRALTHLELSPKLAERGVGKTALIPTIKQKPPGRVHLAAEGKYNPAAPVEGGATESLKDVLDAIGVEAAHAVLEEQALPDGWTPLMHAVRAGRLADVESLLRLGADVMARDRHGNTPLHKAAISGSTDKVTLLVGAGADLEAYNRYGRTPLHEAAHVGWKDVCALLVRIGADPHAKDGPLRDGDTPFHVARDAGWRDCLDAFYANERRRVRLSGGDTKLYSADFPCVEPAPFSPKRMSVKATWGKNSKHGTWGKPPDDTIPLFRSRVTRYW